MNEYFLESLGRKVKVELDFSNYATKTDLKNVTRIDTSSFDKKTDLANLKSDVDKIDIDKFKNIPANLSNLKSKVDKLDFDILVNVPVDLVISTKGLTKDLIHKISIINGAKYFSLGIFQNYLVIIPAVKYIKHFTGTTRVES